MSSTRVWGDNWLWNTPGYSSSVRVPCVIFKVRHAVKCRGMLRSATKIILISYVNGRQEGSLEGSQLPKRKRKEKKEIWFKKLDLDLFRKIQEEYLNAIFLARSD